MNELIKELAEESGMTQYVAAHNKYLERFAALIVREYARASDEMSGDSYRPDLEEMLEHFGVE